MNVNVRSPEVEINEKVKSLLHCRFSFLEKIYDHITGYDVEVRKIDRGNTMKYEIEGRVFVPKNSFFCRERGKTFENTLDQVIENLARQLKWEKEDRVEIW